MQNSTIQTYKYFYKFISKKYWLMFWMWISITLAVLMDMYIPILYKDLFDLIASTAGKPSPEIVSVLVAVLVKISIAYGFMWAFWRVTGFTVTIFQSVTMKEIYNDCFDYLHRHSYNFFSNSFVGSLVRKVGRLVRSFETFADKFYFDMYPLLLRIVIITIVLVMQSPIVGIIVVCWTVLFLLINYLAAIYKLPYDMARSTSDSKVSSFLADTITNNINIKIFSTHYKEKDDFASVTFDNQQKIQKSWFISTYIEAVQAFLMIALEIAIVYIAIKLWQKGVITPGYFVLIQAYILQLVHSLWNFGRNIRDIYTALADSSEMIEILYTPHEVQDLQNAKDLDVKHGKIEFDKVLFYYNKQTPILKNFSLDIKAGQKIGIVGHSGAGKSTLIKLLFRFYDLKSGNIKIDGVDIKYATQDSLRKHLTLVPQDPILFHRSLLDNIKYARSDATMEEVIEASKSAFCHEFIEGFPEKYNTLVGERGVKLSGGERQRVAIARAILKNSKILVMDEATSSLDSKSEKTIQKALHNLLKGKTAIVIAHRLSTIMQMDRIIVIENGEIKEDGSHAELLAKNALYAELWSTQVKGFIS